MKKRKPKGHLFYYFSLFLFFLFFVCFVYFVVSPLYFPRNFVAVVKSPGATTAFSGMNVTVFGPSGCVRFANSVPLNVPVLPITCVCKSITAWINCSGRGGQPGR